MHRCCSKCVCVCVSPCVGECVYVSVYQVGGRNSTTGLCLRVALKWAVKLSVLLKQTVVIYLFFLKLNKA